MRNWLLIFVLILACSGFAYYSVELAEQHVFDYSIDEVERQYYGDQWVLEVRCGDYVYLFVDDIIDFNTIELPSQTDIISCGDSIISITWFEEGSDTFCEFKQIYPEDHPISVIEGMKFDHCIWSDSLNSIVYFAVERELIEYGSGYSTYFSELRIAQSCPFGTLEIENITDDLELKNIEYYNGKQLLNFYHRDYLEDASTSLIEIRDIKEYKMFHFDGERASLRCTYFHGYARDLRWNYECDSYDGTEEDYCGFWGKSLVDLNHNGSIDIPKYYMSENSNSSTSCGFRYNSETGEYEYYRVSSSTGSTNYQVRVHRALSSYIELPDEDVDALYMGYFFGSDVPVFILDDKCYYGENLTQYLPLTYCSTFDSTTNINITDINNDGIHELYGIQNNKLNIFNVKSRLHIEPGWNLVSFPEFEYPVMISSLMPFSLTGFCYYDPVERAYSMEAVADENKPVFMMSMESRTIDLPPYEQLTSFTLNLVPGWNMIGSRNLFVKSEMLTENPAIAAPIYEYDTETSSYIEADILLPTKGYWVLANDSLEITVP